MFSFLQHCSGWILANDFFAHIAATFECFVATSNRHGPVLGGSKNDKLLILYVLVVIVQQPGQKKNR